MKKHLNFLEQAEYSQNYFTSYIKNWVLRMSEKLNEWIKKITECDFPVFKSTVSSISKVTSTDDASASELASIILRDPSLTAKILDL